MGLFVDWQIELSIYFEETNGLAGEMDGSEVGLAVVDYEEMFTKMFSSHLFKHVQRKFL